MKGSIVRFLVLPAIILAFTVGIFVGTFEPASMASAAGVSTMVVLLSAIALLEARREVWYWIFLAVVSLVHATAVMLIPWPKHYNPSKLDILIGLPDLIVVVLIGSLVAKAFNSPTIVQKG